MSTSLNKFETLPPMPKINLLPPGNLKSKKFDSFPPIKTPKLQELNKERVTYPSLNSIKYVKPTVFKPKKKQQVIKQKLKRSKKCNIFKCNNRCRYMTCIFIKSFILCAVIYFILSSIFSSIRKL